MKKLFAVLIAFQLMIIPIPQAHASGIAGMANQLRGMAIAGFGATILAACPLGALAPSVKVFMAAGLVYLLGEIAAGKKQKSEIEGENESVKGTMGGQGGETQLATLEAQLKDKEEKKKVADKRAMFTAASMALMTAAAVLAAMEIPREVPAHPAYLPPLGCNTGTALAAAKPKAAMIGAAFSFLGGGGFTGALITGITIYMFALSSMVGLMNLAAGRVKAFGALAAITGLALMDAKKESSRLQKEIDDLKKLIAQFRLETDDPGDQTEDTLAGTTGGPNSGGVNSGINDGVTSGTGPGGTINPLPDAVTTTRTCMSSTAISSDCTNPLRVQSVNFSGLNDNLELQRVSSQGVQLANDLASGNTSGKADVAAASLASSASKINDELKKQLAKSNAFLKSKGKKAIDYDKEVADTMNSINSAVQNEANKSGTNLASLGLTNAQLDPNAVKATQEITAASATTAVAVPTSSGNAQDAVDPSANAMTAASSTDQKALEESAANSLGKNLDEYESAESDISKNSGESLWRQVSNRYLLNYDRFFEKKKLPAQ